MGAVKHIVLLIVVIFATINISFGQTYSISPDDTIRQEGMMEDLATLSIQQINTSSKNIVLKWKKLSESVPSNWEAAVCDNSFCYTSLLDSGIMISVPPGDYGILLLHITPHVNYGTSIIKYSVWDIDFPNQKDTLTYILTVNNLSNINRIEGLNSVNLFPNPASNDFIVNTSFKSGFTYVIYENTGKEVLTGTTTTNSISLSTESLLNGFYSIFIYDINKSLYVKSFIVQH